MDEESSRFVFEVEDGGGICFDAGVELRGSEQVIRFIEGGGRGVVDCGFEEKGGVGGQNFRFRFRFQIPSSEEKYGMLGCFT